MFYCRLRYLVIRYGISVPRICSAYVITICFSTLTVFLTRATRRVQHVEQELFILSDQMSSPPVFSCIRVACSLVFCLVFCRSTFFLLSFFFWPLYCLSYFDIRFLVTPLVPSNNSSYNNIRL